MRTRMLALVVSLVALPALAKPPKLTLFIAVDSLSADLFWRMRPRFKGGFQTLLAQGAYFPTVHYDYAETVTAAGHSTLSTGTNPNRHGVVGNRVLNRQSGRLDHVFFDATHPLLDAPQDGTDTSPAVLMAETIADRLKLSTAGKGKAITISGKARASIAMGGKLGTAFWFHEPIGRFITGTYYLKELPTWLKAFNDKKPADGYATKDWPLLAPAKEYTGTDDRPFETDAYGMGRTFPHPLNGGVTSPGPQTYAAFMSSPFANDLMVAAAKAAIDGEQLGKDDVPDFLAVSFSAFDRIYHLYGPYSFEAQDAALRLDKALGELLAAADKAAGGRANLDVILCADHGGAAIPEEWAAAGIEGVRVNPETLVSGLKKELSDRYKGELVVGLEESDIYLDQKVIDSKKLDGAAIRRAAAAWLTKQPDIAFAVAKDDLENAQGPYAAALRAGYYPDRSGDVVYALKQFRVLADEATGTSHGGPYSYDTDVPLLLLGRGVKPGFYPGIAHVTDVAPTVAALMEMGNPAMSEGTVRAEALSSVR